MYNDIILWAQGLMKKEEVEGKSILEVGSYDVNGSLRETVMKLNPTRYIGTDMRSGSGVDMVCKAEDLPNVFQLEEFDMVICTEVLEHVEDWRVVISCLKKMCKEGGYLYVTSVSKGFPKHDYPADNWRFELEDMKEIFADCELLSLERPTKENKNRGVFVKAKKPIGWKERDLSDIQLWNIKTEQRG